MTQALTGQAAFSNRDTPSAQQQPQHQLGAALGSTGGSGGNNGGSRAIDQLLYGPTGGSRSGGSGPTLAVATPAASSDPRPAAMFGLAPNGGFLSTGTPSAGSFSRPSYHAAQSPSPHAGGSFHRPSLHAQSPSPHSQAASPMAGGVPAMSHPVAALPQSHWATQAAAVAAAASRPPSAAAGPPQPPSQTPRGNASGLGTLATEPAAVSAAAILRQPAAASSPSPVEQGAAASHGVIRGAESGASAMQGQPGVKRGQQVHLLSRSSPDAKLCCGAVRASVDGHKVCGAGSA